MGQAAADAAAAGSWFVSTHGGTRRRRQQRACREDIHRRFSPAERLRMAFEMSGFARSPSRVGLRSRRPELTDSELDDEMLKRLYDHCRSRK